MNQILPTRHATDVMRNLTAATTAIMMMAGAVVAKAAEFDEADLDRRIAALRQGEFSVTVTDAAGKPVTEPVSYKLVRHEFQFGTAVAAQWLLMDPSTNENARQYQSILTNYFNCAVAENAHKWYAMEPNRGDIRDETALAVYEKCTELGLDMRGHCVLWGNNFVQGWVKKLSPAELKEAILARMTHVLKLFEGKITEWDLNNEMMHGDFYARRLGLTNSVPYFEWAQSIAPSNTYYLNDFPSLEKGGDFMYYATASNMIQAGAAVGGIGEQAHFMETVVPPTAEMWASLDMMEKLNIPYKITEFDINYTDEALQAADTRRFYKTCFAHPVVDAILMWGFWENSHWIPRAAMWRRDWSIKPNGQAFVDLMEEWRTKGEAQPAKNGVLSFRGFFGDYEITCGKQRARLSLKRDGSREVKLRLQAAAAE